MKEKPSEANPRSLRQEAVSMVRHCSYRLGNFYTFRGVGMLNECEGLALRED